MTISAEERSWSGGLRSRWRRSTRSAATGVFLPAGGSRPPGVTAGGGEPLGGDVGGAFERACVTVGAELVGVCRRALDMTVAYVKDRRQFGVPVGSFQAVQHAAAQMLRDTEAASVATSYAAWVADADPER